MSSSKTAAKTAATKTPTQKTEDKEDKQQVAVVPQGTRALSTDLASGFESMAGEGLEKVRVKDLLIPRLALLQALSPQLNAQKPQFMKGAKNGDICDIAMEEIFEPPLSVLPVHYITQWLEWGPNRSGLVAIHATDAALADCSQNDLKQWVNKKGNLVVETAQFYCLNLSAAMRRCFIPMAVTQLGSARKWVTQATNLKLLREDGKSKYTPPFFVRSYSLSATPTSNQKGSWFIWKVEGGEFLSSKGMDEDMLKVSKIMEPDYASEVFEAAIEFRRQVSANEVKADLASMEEHTTEEVDHSTEKM